MILEESKQLKEVVIIISSVDKGNAYAYNKIYRYDITGSADNFIKMVEQIPDVREGGKLYNK